MIVGKSVEKKRKAEYREGEWIRVEVSAGECRSVEERGGECRRV